ncbi:MAG TPA: hypothetical protein DCL61_00230 [Cyanobacteria bacterium UBA12227]|nr:hypothetical protein [Cyanobacteria bacterium UBA12227]HAX89242.1 hypothetical protein [Cyanobacteria bacterium UBA11370]HBY76266.1 hypothetical protein [Cyanobacteria bacterium UBA11148]
MEPQIIWQQNSDNPDNGTNLAKIAKFWSNLQGRKIAWRQRLIPKTENINEIDWESQRFDEEFKLQTSEIRGITLYWRKADSDREVSTTPHKLELDLQQLQLYIYPQSQKELVIRVGIPEVVYQKIEITNPLWEITRSGENYSLILRDKQQQIEVKVILSPDNRDKLKEQLLG